MKIPHKLRIKHRVSYEVLFADIVKDDPDCVGVTCEGNRQIIFKNDQSQTSLEKTAIHEVVHALDFEHKIGLTHRQVYLLEEALHRFLKLNKLI